MSIRPESRAKFEKQGTLLTLHHLKMDNMEPTERIEIQNWLAEEDHKARRKETIRFTWMLGFAIVAAVGALIAAWPVVKEWHFK